MVGSFLFYLNKFQYGQTSVGVGTLNGAKISQPWPNASALASPNHFQAEISRLHVTENLSSFVTIFSQQAISSSGEQDNAWLSISNDFLHTSEFFKIPSDQSHELASNNSFIAVIGASDDETNIYIFNTGSPPELSIDSGLTIASDEFIFQDLLGQSRIQPIIILESSSNESAFIQLETSTNLKDWTALGLPRLITERPLTIKTETSGSRFFRTAYKEASPH